MTNEPTFKPEGSAASVGADAATDIPTPRPLRLLLVGIRLMMLVGIGSLLLASLTLLVFGAVETFRHVIMVATPIGAAMTNREVFLASIKLIDLVLLATILQVVAFGLYALFIDSKIPVPQWLRTGDVDDLKFKLAGIVVVMLAVLFLEEVIGWGSGRDLLPLGIAIAAMIVALSYFIRAHPDKG